ncbi:DarT ssDNA thymidine ADP-ribosyltransferase family protein [Rhodococcus qingshengii]|uniref:DarT ssDNA thymidine ADP-ribosyltransferase family protein n=1 Tax=Rhodococcus qingshengii TaxID=334542 RepID=UPI003602F0AE
MTSIDEVLASVPVSRLVHFTSAVNLDPIFRDGAIRNTEDLAMNAAESYSPTDHQRFDGRPGHVCCSFEYPNAYYHNVAKNKTEFVNYPGWVCLMLNRDLVRRTGTLFSPCNAARANGAYLSEGGQAMLDCWDSPSKGGGYLRGSTHLAGTPTDLQAEVMIPGSIELSDVSAIVTKSADQARELFGSLHMYGLRPERLEWRYSPMLFDRAQLRSLIWRGQRATEVVWAPTLEDLE